MMAADKIKKEIDLLRIIAKRFNVEYENNNTQFDILKKLRGIKPKKWDARKRKSNISRKFGQKIITEIEKKDHRIVIDYGCGSGEMSQYFHKNSKVYCVDIEDNRSDYLKDQLKLIYPNELDTHFKSNTIDLFMFIQSLHHIRDYELILKKAYALLKPGGILVIREHDCTNEQEKGLIVLEHLAYSVIESDMNDEDHIKFVKKYPQIHGALYKNKEWLLNLLRTIGFKLIFYEAKKGNNLTKIYNIMLNKQQ